MRGKIAMFDMKGEVRCGRGKARKKEKERIKKQQTTNSLQLGKCEKGEDYEKKTLLYLEGC